MNSRQDDDNYWNQSERKRFNFDDDDETDGFILLGVEKGKLAQISRDIRTNLVFDNDVNDDTILGGSSSAISLQSYGSFRSARLNSTHTAEFTQKKEDRPVSATEISKLEAEVDSLRRQLKEAADSKWMPMSPNDLVLRIIYGQNYSFDAYKSKEQKLSVLDAALKYHDGNAIVAAVLHMKRTLKSTIFNQELIRRPDAMNHYISYLNSHHEYAELSDVLTMLGQTSDSAMLNYKMALRSKEPKSRLSNLKNCYTNHFQSDPSLASDASLIGEHIALLERQIPIEENDLKYTELQPRLFSVLHVPVITTLYYCCLYHYDKPESSWASPEAIRKYYKLTAQQFTWTAVLARAKLQQWKDIEVLLTTKSLFGSSKIKFIIPVTKLLSILEKHNADTEILSHYVSKVDGAEQRLKLAKKHKCHDVVIETLVAMRDRQQLIAYKTKILPHSTDFIRLQDALKASTIKWKN